MADEWRVEVTLSSEEHGLRLGKRLRALDLDDEARERLGEGVIVTRDGERIFLYAASEKAAREAERVARKLLADEELEGSVAATRWHPDEEVWKDVATAMPASDDERAAERARHQAAASGDGWEVRVDLHSLGDAHELEEALSGQDIHVRRRFRHLVARVATEEEANDLAARIRELAPPDSQIHIEATSLPNPLTVWLSAHKPGIARDLGL